MRAVLGLYARTTRCMVHLAQRIQVRALRRCGELLKEIKPAKNQHDSARMGAHPSRKKAAQEAGLSDNQRKQAIHIANVPTDEFEEQVESDDPPTATELGRQGTRKKPSPRAFRAELHCSPSVALSPESLVMGSAASTNRSGLRISDKRYASRAFSCSSVIARTDISPSRVSLSP
jgi:hypothetical protein